MDLPFAQKMPTRGGRVVAVSSLASLVGSHPRALRTIYERGTALDPLAFAGALHGRILTTPIVESLHLALRPIVKAMSSIGTWEGIAFDHGGNAGHNVVFGKPVMRFRAERATSLVDGEPTLVLDYAVKNPWPVKLLRDELRLVADGIAIGPAFLMTDQKPIMWWFGVESVS
jgi:hypothetical protein